MWKKVKRLGKGAGFPKKREWFSTSGALMVYLFIYFKAKYKNKNKNNLLSHLPKFLT